MDELATLFEQLKTLAPQADIAQKAVADATALIEKLKTDLQAAVAGLPTVQAQLTTLAGQMSALKDQIKSHAALS